MTTNTDGDTVSSTGPEQSEQEVREKRLALMRRAIARLGTEAEHVAQTERVVKPALSLFVKEHSLGEVADIFIQIEEAAARLDDANKAFQSLLSFTREVSLPERMDEEMTKSFSSSSDDQVVRTSRTFASILSGKTDDAFKWLRDNGYASLIKETVNSSSLSAAAKELIENGMELPDDLFGLHIKNGVSIRKAKSKKG